MWIILRWKGYCEVEKMEQKQKVIITNLIDWSESFVSNNGSFYCGTTEEQKHNAGKTVEISDLAIFTTDLHPVTAPEHKINGGLYPVHNAVIPERFGKDFVYLTGQNGEECTLGEKTISPELDNVLKKYLETKNAGIIVPKGVYFQGGSKKHFCRPEDIEMTFLERIITPEEFLKAGIEYVIAPKQYFDATRVDSDVTLPDTQVEGIPEQNYNVYSLLKQRFPEDQYELIFINTGVVEGICRLHTSVGLRQMFPSDRIINISDATTPLAGVGLGYETPQESRDACMKVCKDIGIEYMTTQQVLAEFGGK